jgi:regulation of enolase protein 1 (concanavalin A-like superfamily)
MADYGSPHGRRVYAAASRFTAALALAVIGSFFQTNTLSAQSLPSGWNASDVGSPALAGASSYSNGIFTVTGSGNDIWNPSDQFQFAWQQIAGDVTVVARVDSQTNSHDWAKAGVMVRESLSATSKYAFALVSPGNGIAFQRRTATGGSGAHTGASGTAPRWMRLERRGSTITASSSTTGSSWTTLGSATISMTSTVYVGLAVTSHNPSARSTATFSNVSVTGATGGGTGSSLPTGWTSSDIGSPSLAGTASATGMNFTVAGAGRDIWNQSDQFQFTYRQISGDLNLVARVASLNGPDPWSKAGVMIRASMAANSAHASMFLTPGNGLAFQHRPGTGMSSLHMNAGQGSAPVWLKLERRGSAITAFRSPDGTNWTMVGSQTLTLPTNFFVGLAVVSAVTNTSATTIFTDVTAGAPATGPTPTPPTVSLTAPAAGATYSAPASMAVTASATDSDTGVAMVEFYANGTLIGTDASSPYSFNWSGVAAGSYSLTAVARDNAGAVATSAARSITVTGSTSNSAPTVSLTAPASGATYTAPASVTLSANAADTNGSISRVDFYANGTLVGSDTTSPYSYGWTNVTAGSYSITAVARDNGGASTTSAARSITVTGATMPTRAAFVPSSNHATSVTSYRLDIFTAGANPSSATPMATQNLGKPAIVNGECSADISTTMTGLPGGSYFATLVAIGPGGTSPRTVSGTFTR